MRAAAFLCGVLLAGCVAIAPADAPFPGVRYSRMEPVADVPQAIHVLEIDLTRRGLELVVTPKEPLEGRAYRALTTSEFVARHGLHAAVNAAFFEPFRGGSPGGDDYYPKSGDAVDALPGPKPRFR